MLGEDGPTQSDPAVLALQLHNTSMHSSLHIFEVIFNVLICILKSKRSHYHLEIELLEFWFENSKSPHDNFWCIYAPNVMPIRMASYMTAGYGHANHAF